MTPNARPKLKLPPHDPDAERALLGAMLADTTGKALQAGSEGLPIEAFYTPQLRTVFKAAKDLWEHGTPVDFVTLKHELIRRGELHAVGGVDRLVELAESVPSITNAQHYSNVVKQLWLRRALLETTYRYGRAAKSHDADALTLASQLTQELEHLRSGATPTTCTPKTPADIVLDRRLNRIERRLNTLARAVRCRIPAASGPKSTPTRLRGRTI